MNSIEIFEIASELRIKCDGEVSASRSEFPKFLSIGFSENVASVEQYNSKSNLWRTIHDIPFDIREFAVECVGNQLYFIGGVIGNENTNKVATCF